MNNIERPEQFDIDALRKKVSEIHVRSREDGEYSEAKSPLGRLAGQIAKQFQEESYSPEMTLGIFRLVDFAAILAVGASVYLLYVVSAYLQLFAYSSLIGTGSAVALLFMQLADVYQMPSLRSPRQSITRSVLAWTLTFAGIVMALFFMKESSTYSRVFLASWYLIGIAYFVVARVVTSYGLKRWARNGLMERRAVIVGGGEPAKNLIRSLEAQTDNDIRICGIFDDRGDQRSPELIAGYPKLGTFEELVEFARLARIDMLIISLPLTAEARIIELLRKLWVLPADIRIAGYSSKLRFRPRSYSHVGKVAMLDVFDKPISDWDSVAKRGFDLFFSVVALALLWPIMLGAALAVKLTSKGPVFFVQKRHGFNNEIINVYKFRSMYTEMSDPTARQAVTKGDPRVTPVGRFIRKSSIDELPQLFNVLRGDLSLVGPRPHAVLAQTADRKYSDIVESYFARHKVKPGVTGWAQINGWRGEVDNDDKIKYRTAFDLYYIENWSLWFDLKVLFLTPFSLLNTENAY